jgi:hypothetical protein
VLERARRRAHFAVDKSPNGVDQKIHLELVTLPPRD